MIPLIGLVILQSIIFAVAIGSMGALKEVRLSAYDTLKDKTDTRKATLQTQMIQNWSNYDNFYALAEICRKEKAQTDGGEASQVSRQVGENLISLLRNSFATGAFVVYEKSDAQTDAYQGLYLRDSDPAAYSGNNADILAEFGSGNLIKELGLTMDSRWTSHISLNRDVTDPSFYNKMKKTAQQYSEIAVNDLGYWSKPFRLHPDGPEILTYTVPLLDKENRFLGVAGIEISLDYLYTLLPYRELADSQKGSYIFGLLSEDNKITTVLETGPMFKNIASSGREIILDGEPRQTHDIFYLKDPMLSEKMLGAVSRLKLYNTNTPFEEEQWVLIGIVAKHNLLRYANRLALSLSIAFLAALLIGILECFLLSSYFASPFTKMVNALKKSNPEELIKLPKANIAEIDQLASAVEKLSVDVKYSASRLSQILEMVEMPIGTIEIDRKDKIVSLRGKVAELMDLPDKKRMPFDEYKKAAERFESQSSLYEESENRIKDIKVKSRTLHYTNENDVNRWVNFKIIHQEREILIVVQDLTAEIKEKLKIEYERDYDVLTHLLNRRSYRAGVEQILSEPINGVGAMVMWDLDNLKYINDTYGHDFGDQYIREAAKVFSTLRVQNAIVGRLSGDEFTAFFYHYTDKNDIRFLIHRVHSRLIETEPKLPEGIKIKLRASAGIAWYPDDALNYEQLLKQSDFAMYSAKTTLKGAVKEFDRNLYQRDKLLFSGKEELNRFIEKQLVRFAYQPIVDCATGEVFGYEALMRPQSKSLQTVNEVLRVAKAQSKLYPIEVMTVNGAMKGYTQQKDAFGERKIFINSIPNTCISKDDLNYFEALFKPYLNKIVLEIIEIEQMNTECMRAKQLLKEQWNMQIALDDFGAGYGTEFSLLCIAPNYVKIDRSIIHGIDRDPDRQKIVSNMLSYTRPRNMKVIAEGIENFEECRYLIEAGVDYLQGFYLAEPSFTVLDIPEKMKILIRSLNEN